MGAIIGMINVRTSTTHPPRWQLTRRIAWTFCVASALRAARRPAVPRARYAGAGAGADAGPGSADGTEEAGTGDPHGGAVDPAGGAAAVACVCTCERLARWRAEGDELAEEAARVAETLDLAAMAAGATIPAQLAARMDQHAAFEPCLDRCIDARATPAVTERAM